LWAFGEAKMCIIPCNQRVNAHSDVERGKDLSHFLTDAGHFRGYVRPCLTKGNRCRISGRYFPMTGNLRPILGPQFSYHGNPCGVSGRQFRIFGTGFRIFGKDFLIFGIQFPILGNAWPIYRNRVCMSGNGRLMAAIGCKPLAL